MSVAAQGVTANNQAVPSDGLSSLAYDQPSNHINTPGYEYDLAGNLTRGQDQAGNWQRYQYDAANRLVNVTDDAGNQKMGNGYTSSRQRLVSNNNINLTWYVWGGSSVISE